MSAQISLTPMATTNAYGLFNTNSAGFTQGDAVDDPAVKFYLLLFGVVFQLLRVSLPPLHSPEQIHWVVLAFKQTHPQHQQVFAYSIKRIKALQLHSLQLLCILPECQLLSIVLVLALVFLWFATQASSLCMVVQLLKLCITITQLTY